MRILLVVVAADLAESGEPVVVEALVVMAAPAAREVREALVFMGRMVLTTVAPVAMVVMAGMAEHLAPVASPVRAVQAAPGAHLGPAGSPDSLESPASRAAENRSPLPHRRRHL